MTRIPISELGDPVDIETTPGAEPFQGIPTGVDEIADFDPHICVDTVHDGWIIPERFLEDFDPEDMEDLRRRFDLERDWGAHWVALRLARELKLSRCHRVTLARALLDFNRFPGVSPDDADHLGRLAINPPFSSRLSFEQKSELVTGYYDTISTGIDTAVAGRLIKIAIHTYDTHNESGTERPAVSLINRPLSYQLQGSIPGGAFDPMFPQIIGEFMASRVLTFRMALSLEKAQVPVSLNYPYLLPDGGVEIRSQVWFFFRHLKTAYEAAHAYHDDTETAAFQLVWNMLLDTNTRSSASMAFSEYLHAFRRPPKGLGDYFERGRAAYESIDRFLHANWEVLVENYRHSDRRPSSLAVEVRKDFLWELQDGRPTHLKVDDAERAVIAMADGIEHYLREDIRLLDREAGNDQTDS